MICLQTVLIIPSGLDTKNSDPAIPRISAEGWWQLMIVGMDSADERLESVVRYERR